MYSASRLSFSEAWQCWVREGAAEDSFLCLSECGCVLRVYGEVDLVMEGDDEVMMERDICVVGEFWSLVKRSYVRSLEVVF